MKQETDKDPEEMHLTDDGDQAGKDKLILYNGSGDTGISWSMLDDIIERLVHYDKYPGYTIHETKVGTQNLQNLPYILKEKEIRQLISAAE